MIRGLTVLLLCQLAGEAVARTVHLPVPGPVLGMMLLVLLLWARDRWLRLAPADGSVSGVADGLLANLAVLFVPAGVGVMQQGRVLAAHGIGLAAALVISTILTLVVTVLVFLGVKRWMNLA